MKNHQRKVQTRFRIVYKENISQTIAGSIQTTNSILKFIKKFRRAPIVSMLKLKFITLIILYDPQYLYFMALFKLGRPRSS